MAYLYNMSKGTGGCDTVAMSELSVDALLTRPPWVGYLSGKMDEVIKEAAVGPVGEETRDRLLRGYLEGEGEGMSDTLGQLRLHLGEMLCEDEEVGLALQLLDHPSVDPLQSAEMLKRLKGKVASATDRGRLGSGVVLMLCKANHFKEARDELKADIENTDLPDSFRSLAQSKLEAIENLKQPQDRILKLLPPGFTEREGLAGAYADLVQYSQLQATEGFMAASSLIRELSDAGEHRAAVQLARILVEAQEGPSRYFDRSREILVQALRDADRPDEALALQEGLVEELDNQQHQFDVMVDIYDQAGMTDHAMIVAKRRRSLASDSEFTNAQMDYTYRLVLNGEIEEALTELERHKDRMKDDTTSAKISVFSAALHSIPDRAERSRVRNCLAGDLQASGKIVSAIDFLEDDLADPGIDPATRRLCNRLIAELESELEDNSS